MDKIQSSQPSNHGKAITYPVRPIAENSHFRSVKLLENLRNLQTPPIRRALQSYNTSVPDRPLLHDQIRKLARNKQQQSNTGCRLYTESAPRLWIRKCRKCLF